MLTGIRKELGIVAGAVLAFIAACWTLVDDQSPLGHDEAVYALRGLYFSSGTPELGYWNAYRAPGMPFALGIANRIFDEGPGMNRMVVSMFGLLGLFAGAVIMYRLTRSRITSVLVPLCMLGFSGYLAFSTILLADIPGLAVSLVALAALIWAFGDDMAFRSWAMGVVPLLAIAATTTRYGSPIVFASGVAGITVAFARKVFLSPHRIATTVKFAITMVLSLAGMIITYTTTWISRTDEAPSLANSQLNDPKFELVGRWDSVQEFMDLMWPGQPSEFGAMSFPFTFLVFLALVGIAVELVRFGMQTRHIEPLAAMAVAWVVWAGIMNYALPLMVPQYIMLGAFFFAGFVAVGLDLLRLNLMDIGRIRSAAQPLALVALVLLFLPPIASSYSSARSQHDVFFDAYTVLRNGSKEAAKTLGDDCVLMTGASPQVGYFSRCAINAARGAEADRETWVELTEYSLNEVRDYHELGRVGFVYLNKGKRQLSPEVTERVSDMFIPNIVDIGADEDGRRQHFWVSELIICDDGTLACHDE